MDERAVGPWRRDREKEQQLKGAPWPMLCFRCTAQAERPAASLWLAVKEGRELYVPNILPDELERLSQDQYNRVLEDFHDRITLPATEGLGLKVAFTSEVATLDRWLRPGTIEKLRVFSRVANRSTGSGHPADEARWFDFVFTAHREDSSLPMDMLRRWLQEEEHWHEDGASELARQYENARWLLKAYDRFRA
jgi:hypothetical protein